MIEKALTHYDFNSKNAELIRHSEKMTYKITDGEKAFALRIHIPTQGFDVNDAQVFNEIMLFSHISKKGNLLVQKVISNKDGRLITLLDGETPVTVLEWLSGSSLDSIGITESIAYEIGVMTGKLHNDFKDITINNPRRYDDALISTLLNKAACALEQNHFNERQAKVIIDTLTYIQDYLLMNKHRLTLVHGDLSHSNIIYHKNTVVPIDFSSAGYGLPEMDLAMIFGCLNDENFNNHVLDGYKSICDFTIDYSGIDICSCLCILLFIVGQHERGVGLPWFKSKTEEWCGKKFIPLLDNEKKEWLNLWKDVF